MRLVVDWNGYKCFNRSLISPRRFGDFREFHHSGHDDSSLITVVQYGLGRDYEEACKEVKKIRV